MWGVFRIIFFGGLILAFIGEALGWDGYDGLTGDWFSGGCGCFIFILAAIFFVSCNAG